MIRGVTWIVALIAIVMLTSPVYASPKQPPTATSTVRLVVDCKATMKSDKGKEYATKHKLCKELSSGEVIPDGTTTGDCGYATLEVYQGRRSGEADIFQELKSTQGWMTYIHTVVNWSKASGSSGSGSIDHEINPYFSGDWSADDFRTTGTGALFAQMTHAWVQTLSGVTCVGMNPTDIENIR